MEARNKNKETPLDCSHNKQVQLQEERFSRTVISSVATISVHIMDLDTHGKPVGRTELPCVRVTLHFFSDIHVIGYSDLVDLWVKKPMILCARCASRSGEQSTKPR